MSDQIMESIRAMYEKKFGELHAKVREIADENSWDISVDPGGDWEINPVELIEYQTPPADLSPPPQPFEIEAARWRPPTINDLISWLHNHGANDIAVENGAPGTVNISVSVGSSEGAPLLEKLNRHARACFPCGIIARVRCRNTYTGLVTETIVPRGDEK